MPVRRPPPRTRAARRRAAPRRARPRLPPRPTAIPPGPEPAHAHIVCRRCGRIAHLALEPGDLENLAALVERRPNRWTVDGIAYSLTGVCPRCSAEAS